MPLCVVVLLSVVTPVTVSAPLSTMLDEVSAPVVVVSNVVFPLVTVSALPAPVLLSVSSAAAPLPERLLPLPVIWIGSDPVIVPLLNVTLGELTLVAAPESVVL